MFGPVFHIGVNQAFDHVDQCRLSACSTVSSGSIFDGQILTAAVCFATGFRRCNRWSLLSTKRRKKATHRNAWLIVSNFFKSLIQPYSEKTALFQTLLTHLELQLHESGASSLRRIFKLYSRETGSKPIWGRSMGILGPP